MHRFADGDYAGVPYSHYYDEYTTSEVKKQTSVFGGILRFLVVLTIVAAVVVMNCLVLSDLGVK